MVVRPIRVLGLAAGGAGLERGIARALLRLGRASRLVCAVEVEAYAAAVLAARMAEGALDDAPLWSDLRTFDARPWRGAVDLVAAGYPCQPFSLAGKRGGSDDPRHLWPHVARVVAECRPALCVFENVGGHLSLGAREVAGELQVMGYRTAASLWTAEEVGALHRRERVFIVAAHPERIELRHEQGWRCGPDRQGTTIVGDDGASRTLADSDRLRELQPSRSKPVVGRWPGDCGWWATEPDVGRVAHGVAARVERLRLLGNGVVPQQAEAAVLECLDALGIGG